MKSYGSFTLPSINGVPVWQIGMEIEFGWCCALFVGSAEQKWWDICQGGVEGCFDCEWENYSAKFFEVPSVESSDQVIKHTIGSSTIEIHQPIGTISKCAGIRCFVKFRNPIKSPKPNAIRIPNVPAIRTHAHNRFELRFGISSVFLCRPLFAHTTNEQLPISLIYAIACLRDNVGFVSPPKDAIHYRINRRPPANKATANFAWAGEALRWHINKLSM